jgi:hypothetical protein
MRYDEVAGGQHGLLTVQQARASGLSRSQLRTLVRTGRVRVVDGRCLSVHPAPTEHKAIVRERALAALLRLPAAARITCITAAELFGWERSGLVPDDGLVHVYLPRAHRRTAPAGVRLHVGPPVDQSDWAWDVRCLPQPQVLADLIRRLPVAEATVVVESALRVDSCLAAATTTLPHARGLSESALEALGLALWRLAALPQPIQQATIRLDGRFVARVDFLWPEAMLVVELDGMAKYVEPRALRDEKRRQNALVAQGFVVLRFSWADVVHRPNAVVGAVASTLQTSYTEVVANWVSERR